MNYKSREIYYCEPVFRPPSEAYSLLIQATEGCTFHCSFCVSNLRKHFKVRDFSDICRDIDIAAEDYGKSVQKIFLLDGNGFVMKPQLIIDICKYAYSKFPNLERVGAYAHAKDILMKTPEDLKRISEAGFKIAYVGIETGDNELLKQIGKQTSADDLAKAAQMLHEADITFSGTVILGLAGNDPELSKKHAIATAEVINRMNPPTLRTWYISALTLMIPPGTGVYEKREKKEFREMNSIEILKEMRIMLNHISDDLHGCIFRSNHASNYLPIKGVLANDKKTILKTIDYGLSHPDSLRPEYFRGL